MLVYLDDLLNDADEITIDWLDAIVVYSHSQNV